MSLRGRYIVDRIKASVSRYFTLPVPPYQNPNYWEGVYSTLGPDDVFEWGNLSSQDLFQYSYQLMDYAKEGTVTEPKLGPIQQTTLAETINVYPQKKSSKETKTPVLILGCGNSKLGEDMVDAGWQGPLFQVDVSTRLIESMSQRCSEQQRIGDIQFIQDDATVLSSFQNGQVSAVIDKGLVDALFCTDEYDLCYDIMQAVHRVLTPGGVFICLSFSQPQFLLETLVLPYHKMAKRITWQDVQIRQLNSILMYRFQKQERSTLNHRRR